MGWWRGDADVATQLQGWFFEVAQAVNATQTDELGGGMLTFLEGAQMIYPMHGLARRFSCCWTLHKWPV